MLECLPDPDALVAEAARILRPGGRLVLAHTDYDTLVFTSDDLGLTRRLVHAYCDTQRPWMDAVDGTIGRHLVEVAGRCGLVIEDVQASVVLSRRFLPGELGWGYAHNIVGALRAPAGRSRRRSTLESGNSSATVAPIGTTCSRGQRASSWRPSFLLGGAYFVLPPSGLRAVVYCATSLGMVVAVFVGVRMWRPSRPLAWVSDRGRSAAVHRR